MSKAKIPAEKGWARIDPTCKPSKAASTEGLRPALQHGYIEHDKDGSWLWVTDSYMMVRIPITMDCAKNQRKKVLPPGPIISQALKALDRSRTGYFRIKDGCVEVFGEPMLYPLPDGIQGPKFREIFTEPNGDKQSLDGVTFNPILLNRLSEAVGAGKMGVTLEFKGKLKPIWVKPLAGPGEAILMPIRGRGE